MGAMRLRSLPRSTSRRPVGPTDIHAVLSFQNLLDFFAASRRRLAYGRALNDRGNSVCIRISVGDLDAERDCVLHGPIFPASRP